MHRLPPVKTIFQRLIFSTTKAPGHENQVVNDRSQEKKSFDEAKSYQIGQNF